MKLCLKTNGTGNCICKKVYHHGGKCLCSTCGVSFVGEPSVDSIRQEQEITQEEIRKKDVDMTEKRHGVVTISRSILHEIVRQYGELILFRGSGEGEYFLGEIHCKYCGLLTVGRAGFTMKLLVVHFNSSRHEILATKSRVLAVVSEV